MTRTLSSTWQPDIFGGAGKVREPGKDRADNLRRAGQEMRDSRSSDLFDAMPEQDVTVEANVVTFHRPAGGWPTLAQLIARSIALGGDPFGPQTDDVEYGSWCPFCGNRAAVCRCDS